MAYFYSIRGWLEVEPENFASAIDVVKSLQESYPKDTQTGLYLQGWCWKEQPINWTHYLFYGADVTEDGLEFFENTLNKLIAKKLNLSGYFHAQGEDGERNFIYKVTDDNLWVEMGSILVVVT
ncbi:MAG: hypothetical protein KME30_14530 [Iphinoe sp. HA4291-MV1]|jgi:hypothetical protein|nr:hypothetical protein [Iphinoe sp. HA4291-MV1]